MKEGPTTGAHYEEKRESEEGSEGDNGETSPDRGNKRHGCSERRRRLKWAAIKGGQRAISREKTFASTLEKSTYFLSLACVFSVNLSRDEKKKDLPREDGDCAKMKENARVMDAAVGISMLFMCLAHKQHEHTHKKSEASSNERQPRQTSTGGKGWGQICTARFSSLKLSFPLSNLTAHMYAKINL